MTQCSATRRDGSPCPVGAVEGLDPPYCQFHRVDVSAETRRELRSHGGRRPQWITRANGENMDYETLVEIAYEILNNERQMEATPGTASAMNSTLKLMLDMYELHTLGARADQIEELLRSMKGNGYVQ